MKKVLFLLLIATCLISKAQTISIMSTKPTQADRWVGTHFARGKVPPFSFVLDGKASSQFITKWKYKAILLPSEDERVTRRRFSYTDPKTLMQVDCDVTTYSDYQAVEWVLHFTNGGSYNSAELSNIQESDIQFHFPTQGESVLHYFNGSIPSRSDFAPHDHILHPGDTLMLRNREGGRSSALVAPFFNIEHPASEQGIMTAIGWTGDWQGQMISNSNRDCTYRTGLANLQTYLLPGESIRTASVAMLFWHDKNRFEGHNQWRRFILAHHTRKIDGKWAHYPYFFGFSWGDPAPCNEYTCMTNLMAKALLQRQEKFGLKAEASWLDAGWYIEADQYQDGKNWANTVGNWIENPDNWPNGLRELSDACHQMGRKFMVWFEPERVIEGTKWAREHPEFMLRLANNSTLLFNLADSSAVDWLCQYIGDFIERNGIDYYRQDFNMNPADFWHAADQPGRHGITEVRYICGLYRYWDYLLERFPRLLIDNCASGGMRLDWETTLRSAPMWRTDDCYYNDPSDMQCHTYGINLFLPQSGTGFGLPDREDKYSLRSSMGSSMVYNWKIMTNGENVIKMQECQREYLLVRPYFTEDYYPLTGTNGSDAHDNWLAYQLHRPSDDTGFVVAFRHHDNTQPTYSVKLYGLSPDVSYRLTNQDDGTSQVKLGKELMENLQLNLPEVDSSLLLYVEKE